MIQLRRCCRPKRRGSSFNRVTWPNTMTLEKPFRKKLIIIKELISWNRC